MDHAIFRGRRLRNGASLRDIVRETHLKSADLIMPYIVVDTEDEYFCKEISSMPGQFQLSVAMLKKRVAQAVAAGLRSLILFGVPQRKDPEGSQGWSDDSIVCQAVAMLKENWPDLVVITDVCLCEYTSHGHCGLGVKSHIVMVWIEMKKLW